MKKILTLFIAVIFMCNILFSTQLFALDQADLIAKSALLMDKKTGRILWEKNSTTKMAMASTTKIMTCIVALENASLENEVVVSRRAAAAPKVKLYIREGEIFALGDLLYALMLESSNDVAVAVAEGVSGSVEEFCALMTKKAKEIGALNTSYKTPNGLDADGHYTTAYDLALITKYALENEAFTKIINTSSFTFYDSDHKRTFSVNNKNAFLNLYEGANGVKTGYTGDAGYCFVGSVKQGDMELIAVILASGWPPNKTFKWKDTIALMNYGFKHYKYQNIVVDKKIVAQLDTLKYGKVDEVEGILSFEINLILKEEEKVHVIYHLYPFTEAPIFKDDVIGQANVYVNDEIYSTFDIKATHTVEKIDYKYCWDYVLKVFTTVGGK